MPTNSSSEYNGTENVTALWNQPGFFDDTRWANITVTVFTAILAIVGTFGNICVIIITRSTPSLKTWWNSFHINLALVDLFMSIFGCPAFFLTVWSWDESTLSIVCFLGRILAMGPFMNIVILTNISILRAAKFHKPTLTENKHTCFFKTCVTVHWIIGAVYFALVSATNKAFVLPLQCQKGEDRPLGVLFVITYTLGITCVIVTSISYLSVVKKILKQRKMIQPYYTGHTVHTISRDVADMFLAEVGDNTNESSSPTFAPLGRVSRQAKTSRNACGHMDKYSGKAQYSIEDVLDEDDQRLPEVSSFSTSQQANIVQFSQRGNSASVQIRRTRSNANPALDAIDIIADETTDAMEVRTGAGMHYAKLIQKDHQVIMSSLIVLATFLISILPFLIINMVFELQASNLSKNQYIASIIAGAFAFINSCANPYIYTLRSRVFRKRLGSLVHGTIANCFRRRGSSSQTVENNFI